MSAPGAVRAELTMQVRPEDRERFIAAWRDLATGVGAWPGFVHQDLSEEVGEPGRFVITSEWADPASFRAFETDPAQDELTAPLRALRTSASMRVLGRVG